MDDNEQTSGLDVLRSSLGSAMESGGPLASVIRRSMEKAGVPEEISVDYEPYRAPEREMPARQTQYRDELMRQLQSTTEKLLTPKPEPKNLLEALSRRFVMPTGKSGDLLIARQERAAKEEEEDLKRREAILSILDKQARLEREQEEDLARARAAEAEASTKKSPTNIQELEYHINVIQNQDQFPKEKVEFSKGWLKKQNYIAPQTPDRAPRPSQFDRLVQARLRQQQGTATPEDKIIIGIAEGKKLTPKQQTKDREILNAREKTKNLNERELRSLKIKARIDPNAEETLRLWELAQRSTFQEMLDDINAETSSNVIEEEMP
jgi:hypothetical protein